MSKLKKSIALVLVLVIVVAITTSSAFAIAAEDNGNNEQAVSQISPPSDENSGITPLRNTYGPFTVGGYIDGTQKERGPVNIYSAMNINNPLNGLVTINVLNFNPVFYQLDIWIYNKSGLLRHEDNWTKLGSSNVFTAVNVTAIDIRIKPRADLITKPKAFEVEIIY